MIIPIIFLFLSSIMVLSAGESIYWNFLKPKGTKLKNESFRGISDEYFGEQEKLISFELDLSDLDMR